MKGESKNRSRLGFPAGRPGSPGRSKKHLREDVPNPRRYQKTKLPKMHPDGEPSRVEPRRIRKSVSTWIPRVELPERQGQAEGRLRLGLAKAGLPERQWQIQPTFCVGMRLWV